MIRLAGVRLSARSLLLLLYWLANILIIFIRLCTFTLLMTLRICVTYNDISRFTIIDFINVRKRRRQFEHGDTWEGLFVGRAACFNLSVVLKALVVRLTVAFHF